MNKTAEVPPTTCQGDYSYPKLGGKVFIYEISQTRDFTQAKTNPYRDTPTVLPNKRDTPSHVED